MSRSPFPIRRVAASVLAAVAAVTTPAFAQSYTLYGTGCAGPDGVLALHHDSLPILGQRLHLELTHAVPNAPALLLFGVAALPQPFDLMLLGSPGCLLYTMPDLTTIVAFPNGNAAGVSVDVPMAPGLAGAEFHNQWVQIDPVSGRIVTSNAGVGVIGALPPPIVVRGITPSTGFLSVGQSITIRTANLGVTDPADLCMQLSDPHVGFGRSVLRATSITVDPNTGDDVITAQLAIANPSPISIAHLMIMRGDGSNSAVSGTACLTSPPSAWAWLGTDLPGMGVTVPTNLMPVLPAATQNVPFNYDSSANALVADLPPYPWAGSGLYPPGASATTDAHGDLSCGGGVPGGHFDHFLEAVTVKASCSAGITNQAFVLEHAPQIQAAFDNSFGVGRVTVSTDTTGTNARIFIRPTNPNCTLTGGAGTIMLGQ